MIHILYVIVWSQNFSFLNLIASILFLNPIIVHWFTAWKDQIQVNTYHTLQRLRSKFRLKTSMNEKLSFVVDNRCMSIAADWVEFTPLGLLSIVYLNQRNGFFWIIWSASHNNQIASHEADNVLIPTNRRVSLWFRRCYPIPTSISVLPQTPNII